MEKNRENIRYPVTNKPDRCPWCGNFFKQKQIHQEIFIEANFVYVKSYFNCLPKGEWVEIKLTDGVKSIGMIPKPNSKIGKKVKCDVVFLVCPKCVNSAIAQLEQEDTLFKEVGILNRGKDGSIKWNAYGGIINGWEV